MILRLLRPTLFAFAVSSTLWGLQVAGSAQETIRPGQTPRPSSGKTTIETPPRKTAPAGGDVPTVDPKAPARGVPTPIRGEAPPPPANPLVLDEPQAPTERPLSTGSPTRPTSLRAGERLDNTPPDSERTFGDYRRGPGTPPADKAATTPLEDFGYRFFEPARQIIEARRASLQRRYESPEASAALPADDPAGTTDRPLADAAENPDAAREEGSESKRESFAAPAKRARPDARRDNAASVDGFSAVVDPLTQLSRNVTASAPPGYQLAPGDALIVRYWSPTRAAREVNATVDAQGGIALEGMGRLVVRGMTTAQAENLLRERLGRLYKRVEVSVGLKELRTIAVTVSGESFAPGTYVVPAVATAFNVLYASGGPSEAGSLRRIEVRRQGALVGTLDFYKFLLVGDKAADLPLRPGDLLYIPPRVSRVTVSGEVRRPAVFELLEAETLRDALRYAGDVKPSAVDQRVQISTVSPGTARVLKDVDLRDTAQAKGLPLYDGDVVEVFSVRATLMNRVTIEGAVDQPGDYALTSGMRVGDLLMRARGPLGDAYLVRADLYRWNPDNTQSLVPIALEKALAGDSNANVPLMRWDRLKIYARQEVAWTGRREVTVRGAVQRPGLYYRSENLRVRDLLLMAGGTTPDAHQDEAVLLHQRADGTYRYQTIRLGDALRGDPAHDVLIEDNDVFAVYRAGEARFTPERTVSIRGEVVTPGVYPRGEDMKLSDLLKVAGGFRPGAGSQVSVARPRRSADDPDSTVTVTFDSQGRCASKDDVVLRDGDVVTIQGIGGFRDRVAFVTVKGAVNNPGPVVLSNTGMRLTDALKAVGGLRPEAFPEGTEFRRSPALMATAGQRDLAKIISQLNDLLNKNTFEREQAKSDIERIRAVGNSRESAPPLAALTGGKETDSAPGAAATSLVGQLSQRDLVSAPRTLADTDLAPDGGIAVDLAGALRRPGGDDDLVLLDGDTITIPERPSTIQVVGAVFNARGVLFKQGAKLDHYVAQCGGFTPDAARDRIVVIHAGGGLVPASKAGALRPGDVIMIPTRVLAEKLARRGGGLDDLFRGITNSAITLRLATSLFGL